MPAVHQAAPEDGVLEGLLTGRNGGIALEGRLGHVQSWISGGISILGSVQRNEILLVYLYAV